MYTNKEPSPETQEMMDEGEFHGERRGSKAKYACRADRVSLQTGSASNSEEISTSASSRSQGLMPWLARSSCSSAVQPKFSSRSSSSVCHASSASGE